MCNAIYSFPQYLWKNLFARLSATPNGLVDTKCHKDHGHQQDAENGAHQHCKRKTGYLLTAAPRSIIHPFFDDDLPNATQCQALCQVCGETATNRFSLRMFPRMWGRKRKSISRGLKKCDSDRGRGWVGGRNCRQGSRESI